MPTTLATSYRAFIGDIAHHDDLHPYTVRAYRKELTAAAADARFRVALDEVTVAAIETWITRASAPRYTVRRRAALFERFFVWAVAHGLCAHNPLAGAILARVCWRTPHPIDDHDDQRAIDVMIAAAPLPYRLVYTMLHETGLRINEILNLRVGDITLEPGHATLRVRAPHGRTTQTLILDSRMTPYTLSALLVHYATLRNAADNEPVFRARFHPNARVSYTSVYHQWVKLCVEAGLVTSASTPRYALHQLRPVRDSGPGEVSPADAPRHVSAARSSPP